MEPDLYMSAGTGKTSSLIALTAGKVSFAFSDNLSRDTAALDWLHTSLASENYQALAWWSAGATITTGPIASWSALPATALAPTVSFTPSASPMEHFSYSDLGFSFTAANPLQSGDMLPFGLISAGAIGQPNVDLDAWWQTTTLPVAQHDLPQLHATPPAYGIRESATFIPGRISPSPVLAAAETLFRKFRKDLLRKVRRARARRQPRLARPWNLRSRCPSLASFALILLATSRCFGHREEPSDHTVPALTPMSAVIGEAACSE